MLPNFESDDTPQSNYPIESDSSFTPDEIESIQKYKENLQKRLNKNQSVLKGIEAGFWGLTSYSIARFLILTIGNQGVGLAMALSVLINNITNRDCFDAFNLDRKDGEWNIEGMGKLIKFGFSTLVACFIIWNATGDLLKMADSSKETYNALQNKVEQFNNLPDSQQRNIFIVVVLVGLGGIYTIIDSLDRR
ncbi:MAG: hypothetical protein KME64_00300 [Scytonematopsis contorta HA4267-MV1]|jgi:hypothetical protein|nr:hypothetical protein [Scytonematopsis contorta HA4267-MV1]